MATGDALTPARVRALFPEGSVMHNPVSGEYGRLLEHTDTHVIGELLAVPGGAVPGAHRHPAQSEHFEVMEGVLGYRRGDDRGEIGAGESITVPAGVVHDWWNAGHGNLLARVTVTPPGFFTAMIGSVWGLAVLGRTTRKGMPKPLEAALLAEALGDEIVFERPPRVVQTALAATVAPLARRRGLSVTSDEVLLAAKVDPARWPALRPGCPTAGTSVPAQVR